MALLADRLSKRTSWAEWRLVLAFLIRLLLGIAIPKTGFSLLKAIVLSFAVSSLIYSELIDQKRRELSSIFARAWNVGSKKSPSALLRRDRQTNLARRAVPGKLVVRTLLFGGRLQEVEIARDGLSGSSRGQLLLFQFLLKGGPVGFRAAGQRGRRCLRPLRIGRIAYRDRGALAGVHAARLAIAPVPRLVTDG